MKKRKLGSSGMEVAPLAFGGNVFGWTADEKTSFQLLDAFVDRGFNFIDTADTYSRWAQGNVGGESETIIGNWLKKSSKRKDIIIATKVGGDIGNGIRTLKRNHILKGVDASLKRLRTDYIDLYQSHYDDESVPIEEVLATYNDIIKAGKVRIIGTSNMSATRIKESIELARKNNLPEYQTLQPLYNLYDREKFEKEYPRTVDNYKLSVISYYSLASGFLSGKYRSENDLEKSKRGGGIKKYLNERGIAILNALDEVAKKYNSTPAEISIAWLLNNPYITAPIASATNLEQLNSLMRSVEIELDGESMRCLKQASSY